MKEWLEVIRDTNYFNLLVMHTKYEDTGNFKCNFDTPRGPVTLQYDRIHPIINPGWDDAPDFIAVSDVHSHATTESTPNNLVPHAADPAPAQRAGSIAFIWGDQLNGTPLPYREDGFPAVVVAVNLAKYYQHGQLTRKRQHPAIKAEYLAALWYSNKDDESCYRNNGPSAVVFENYKEFWIEDEFKGQRWSDHTLDWKIRPGVGPDDEDTLGNFLDNLSGTTNMFTDVYFANETDEVCYITDFA